MELTLSTPLHPHTWSVSVVRDWLWIQTETLQAQKRHGLVQEVA
jgi:hypothetical protein